MLIEEAARLYESPVTRAPKGLAKYLRAVTSRWLIVAAMVVALVFAGPPIVDSLIDDDACRVDRGCIRYESSFSPGG